MWRLSKLGLPGELAAALLTRLAGAGAARGGPEIPQAVGSINAVVGQAFFVPLYDLFLTYGGIFRLNFGPKVTRNLLEFCFRNPVGGVSALLMISVFVYFQSFLIVSDPAIAKHILRDNSKAYSKVWLSIDPDAYSSTVAIKTSFHQLGRCSVHSLS